MRQGEAVDRIPNRIKHKIDSSYHMNLINGSWGLCGCVSELKLDFLTGRGFGRRFNASGDRLGNGKIFLKMAN